MDHRDIYGDITSFGSLYRAMRKVRLGVMWKDSTARFTADGLKETYRLRQDLLHGRYSIRPYHVFIVTDPKRRTVAATQIRDRQFQRALCDGGLYEDITEHFIRDNFACQEGRGMDDALERFAELLRRHYRRHGLEGWALKCDVKSYFGSTPHDVAKAAIRKRVQDPDVCRAVEQIIDSFPGNTGIGLGSQVSQLIELAVLDDMDHLIKERLGIKCYVRYMDDFILVHESKEHLQCCRDQITAHLAERGLQLNDKSSLFPLRQGVLWLHRRFVLTETGKVLLKPDHSSFTRERKKLRNMAGLVQAGKLPVETAQHSFLSWAAGLERKKSRRNTAKRRWGMIVPDGAAGREVEKLRTEFVRLFGIDPYKRVSDDVQPTTD